MNDEPHWIAGFFDDLTRARATEQTLLAQGVSADQIQLFTGDSASVLPDKRASSDATLKDVLVDGAIGGVVGAGVGALAQVAIVAANVSLFVASPLLAPLAMLGWGATLGGTVGAMMGAEKKAAPLSALVEDATANGQLVLVVKTQTNLQSESVKRTMHAAVSEVQDIVATGT
ncbi:MAG: hypothetical protein ACM3VZ_01390 [Acidobacteriota bacterium]